MAEKGKPPTIQIVLTPEQRDQVQQLTGKKVEVLELEPEKLEGRIAPTVFS
jgi:hypothetical protein